MTDYDLGGLRMRFGKGAREGNSYTDVVMVGSDGKLMS